MANLTFTKALFPTVATVGGGGSGTGALTPDPKEVSSGNSTQYINLDFGAAVTVDTFFIGFINGNSDFTSIQIDQQTSFANTVGQTLLGSASFGAVSSYRRHAFLKIGAPVTGQYFAYRLQPVSAVDWTVGITLAGLSVQPSLGHEWGAGRQPIDMGISTPLRAGGFAVEPAGRKAAWQFTTADLTDADLSALWDMALDLGISSPVLVTEDPAAAQPALNSGLHYGLLQQPQAYERQLGGHRWSWRVEEWV